MEEKLERLSQSDSKIQENLRNLDGLPLVPTSVDSEVDFPLLGERTELTEVVGSDRQGRTRTEDKKTIADPVSTTYLDSVRLGRHTQSYGQLASGTDGTWPSLPAPETSADRNALAEVTQKIKTLEEKLLL